MDVTACVNVVYKDDEDEEITVEINTDDFSECETYTKKFNM